MSLEVVKLPKNAFVASEWQRLAFADKSRFLIMAGAAGTGKALAVSTPILTTDGWKTMGEIEIGDSVYNDYGKPVQVVAKSEVFTDHRCAKVVFNEHDPLIADFDHLWKVYYPNGDKEIVKTSDLLQRKSIPYIQKHFFQQWSSLKQSFPLLSIEEVDPVPVQCIQVDSASGMFLAGESLIPTHNSRLAAEKMVAICRAYEGVDALIVRQTEKSLVNSTITMLTNKVLAGATDVTHHVTYKRFSFSNGSNIFYAGMDSDDQAEQLRSIGKDGAIDVMWLEEANKILHKYFDVDLRSRLRGKQLTDEEGNTWQQAIITTNPDSYNHWINQEFIIPASRGKRYRIPIEGLTNKYVSVFQSDEPSIAVYQPPFGSNKHVPKEYIEDMRTTKGLANKRMVQGLWVNAEGVVYDMYEYQTHVVRSFDIPEDWERYISIDWGTSSPASIQWWARSPRDIMYLYREIYHTGMDAEQIAEAILEYTYREPKARFAVTDYADPSGGRAILNRRGISTVDASKSIERGIQVVKQRMAVDPNLGEPRIQFFVDALVKEDRYLREKNRPTCTIEELESYQWAEDNSKRNFKEIPLQVNDHGCLVGTTMIHTHEGLKKIKSISIGDKVLTRGGYQTVIDKQLTHDRARIWELHYSDKQKVTVLKGTYDHPVFIVGKGWTKIKDCRRGDVVQMWNGETAHVKLVTETMARRAVYNLTIEGEYHEYYADGILVHNCDAMRYMMMNRYDRIRDVSVLNLGELFSMAGIE